ncbi:bifunctional Ribosomal protein L21-like/L21-like superfamily [Babesia duncani]|uniref:Large ribosomal subunit protein bL21m n=1 Tax=Babesia duncani TaxID=323732 RepID=A0AAD9UNX3_9APIC|nr:bifunctional Ribosomal protein L21-like/L21-like superfamily [Babesia duncani]
MSPLCIARLNYILNRKGSSTLNNIPNNAMTLNDLYRRFFNHSLPQRVINNASLMQKAFYNNRNGPLNDCSSINANRNKFNLPFYNDKRHLVIHKQRRLIGHRLEFIIGKHKRSKANPPRVPIHPIKDVGKNMNFFETYQDLKLRWKKTTKSKKSRMRIARKWRQPRYLNPTDPPTCMFVLHSNLPQTRTTPNKNYNVGDDAKWFQLDIFEKVTVGDLVQIERLKRKQAGDKVTFGTVLLVGSKDWTIIGKPTVPYAKVKATIQQQTLCGDQLSFRYRKSRRISRFLRYICKLNYTL